MKETVWKIAIILGKNCIGIKCKNLIQQAEQIEIYMIENINYYYSWWLESLPQMRSFRELIVVELHQCCDGIINCGQLYQSHLPVLGEKLKCLKKEKFGNYYQYFNATGV